jgi:HPt (histidine-containing phosphotransfer) domain-containing protein
MSEVSILNDSKLFDREDFVERLMGDEDLAKGILSVFIQDMASQFVRLAQALAAGDTKTLRMASHSVKGAAGSVSAPEMQEKARKLEASAAIGDLVAASTVLPELVSSFDRARPLMERFCDGVVGQ